MKLRGYMTVEASYIFSIFTIIVVGLIRLNFYVHNNMLSDVCLVLGGIRYSQAELYYSKDGKIDKEAIANSPVFTESKDFAAIEKGKIMRTVEAYYNEKYLGIDGEMSDTDISEVIDINDNASLVRSGSRLIQVIGGNADED